MEFIDFLKLMAIVAMATLFSIIKDAVTGRNAGKSDNKQSKGMDKNERITVQSREGKVMFEVFHGTTQENAGAIRREDGAFLVGERNKYAEGIYFTRNINEAREYAGRGGEILKIIICCPQDQIVDYDAVRNSKDFKVWKETRDLKSEAAAITLYCLTVLQKSFLKVDQDVHVALYPRHSTNQKVIFKGLHITGFEDVA